MSKSLVIVESPAKAKTIQKYLGKDFVVLASKGHVRDLPKSGLNIDVEHDYKPNYEVLEDHKDVLSDLKKAAKDSDEIFLAPDPDREGEAIAWHIAQELAPMKKPMRRVEFHEITKKGVQDGLSKPRTVDEQRFHAQQARRILDRLIGYELSSVLWKRLCRQVNGHFLSAGRVQSVALRLIVEREEEIRAFVPQEYWPVDVALVGEKRPHFVTHLIEVDGVKVVTPSRDRAVKAGERVISNEADSKAMTSALSSAKFSVRSVEKRERRRRAPPPYITSSLQRDASSRLGFAASRTMQVAQRLYEGIDVGAEGPVGLITYMRTDSTRISNDAIEAVRAHIKSKYGAKFLPEKANFFKTRSSAQDAHEAIRPTNLDLNPDAIKKSLKPDEYKVYKLIYDRFIACQMIEALYDQTTVLVDAVASKEGAAKAMLLRTSGQTLRFAGWLDAYGAVPTGEEVAGEESAKDASADAEDGTQLPELREGEKLTIVDPPGVKSEQKFSQPAPRYNEGTLVKALEELGIGRPSTYAEIVSKVQSRDYVEKQDRALVPTKLGLAKTSGLRARFGDFINYEFTAAIEKDLDRVEEGELKWVGVVDKIYQPFHSRCDSEKKGSEPAAGWPRPQPSDKICDKCGRPMVKRWGPTSDFYACTGYPECKNVVDENPAPPPRVYEGRPCPKCGSDLLVRTARRGSRSDFLGCAAYPRCDFTSPVPLGIKCPKCKEGDVIQVGGAKRKPFWGCSNYATTKCDFRLYQPPVKKNCPQCSAAFLIKSGGKTRPVLKCVSEGCGYEEIDRAEIDGESETPVVEAKPIIGVVREPYINPEILKLPLPPKKGWGGKKAAKGAKDDKPAKEAKPKAEGGAKKGAAAKAAKAESEAGSDEKTAAKSKAAPAKKAAKKTAAAKSTKASATKAADKAAKSDKTKPTKAASRAEATA
ncbi:MAG: type I DNA topoisomerase [Myxococcales bacterium]|nr:type I DNA topoisomerase [Myxococcales bacterium]